MTAQIPEAIAKVKRKSFVLYIDFRKQIKRLSMEQAGLLINCVFDYHATGEYTCPDVVVDFAMGVLISQFERDTEKYEKMCERNRTNGKKNADRFKPRDPVGPSGSKPVPVAPKGSHNDSDNGIDNDSVIDNKPSAKVPKGTVDASEYKPLENLWREKRGTVPFGRFRKALKPVLKSIGPDKTLSALEAYLEANNTDRFTGSVEHFATNHRTYIQKVGKTYESPEEMQARVDADVGAKEEVLPF